ncbi:MAG TPA: DUF2892 domain-containing protein [Bacillus bacterium]|nr:DUF2892 domain-containing protein [Bacillus sp. (in: firmicutes)]
MRLINPTTTKAKMNTNPEVNAFIKRRTESNIKHYMGSSKEDIEARIKDLDYEWDTERILELNFAVIILLTVFSGLFKSKIWLVISFFASVFMVQHSLQGWCPPLPVIRKLGFRTAAEIFEEKEAMQEMLYR